MRDVEDMQIHYWEQLSRLYAGMLAHLRAFGGRSDRQTHVRENREMVALTRSAEENTSAKREMSFWAAGLKRQIYALYLAYRDPRVPWYAKVFGALVVAYAFSPSIVGEYKFSFGRSAIFRSVSVPSLPVCFSSCTLPHLEASSGKAPKEC